MNPGAYAAIVLPGLTVVVASALVLGTDSRLTRALGLGLLLGSQALLSYGTYRLLREGK